MKEQTLWNSHHLLHRECGGIKSQDRYSAPLVKYFSNPCLRVSRTILLLLLNHQTLSDMNHQIMPTDLHSPAFNRVDKTASQQDNAPSSVPAPKQVHRFSWTRFIGLVTLLALLIGFVSLLSKLVTPQVVTAISILGSFLLLRFVVKVILQITFTLLRYLFWFAVLCAILLCVL